MSLFDKRIKLTPVEYPWAKEQLEVALQNAWTHTEVAMQSDAAHWSSSLITDTDRESIAGILKGFTFLEEVVGDHWANIADIFLQPEIMAMARVFSSQEWVHTYAYDLLETTVGIAEQNWEAFQKDPVSLYKLNEYTSFLALDKVTPDWTNLDNVKSIAQGLAIFGGCIEGVSLFGSFALLLSYTNKGLFPGMNQILSWSVRDEDLHSNCAIKLYHELISEYPQAKLSRSVIASAFQLTVDIESEFIKPAFINGSLSTGITYDQAVDFIKHRANLKLNQLGYKKLFNVEKNNPISDWFYPLTSGVPLHDFFIQRANGAAYAARLQQDFNSLDYSF